MEFTVTTDALVTAAYFDMLIATVPAKIGAVIYRSAFDIKSQIQSITPVMTGRLRDSIDVEGSSLSPYQYEAYIGTDVPYGEIVEFGSGTRPPKPYFRPVINAYEPVFIANLAAVLT